MYGRTQINMVPETFEKPEDAPERSLDLPEVDDKIDQQIADQDDGDTKKTEDKPADSTDKKSAPTTTTPSKSTTKYPTQPEASTFIKNAEWVMVKEGKRIGTACNFYLGRVLEVSGFSGENFRANDFDIYAKRNFAAYTAVDFKNEDSEKLRLKKYIWNYPERTPFILQWSRTGFYGHVAILERMGDKLIIYQASLGQHTARRDQTSVDILLNGFNRRTLTVYSRFVKK